MNVGNERPPCGPVVDSSERDGRVDPTGLDVDEPGWPEFAREERPDWGSITAEEADRLCWHIVRHWPRYAGVSVVRGGLDYGELLRIRLGPRVAGAIRQRRDPAGFELERSLLAVETRRAAVPSTPASPSRWSSFRSRLERLRAGLARYTSRRARQETTTFLIPRTLVRWDRISRALSHPRYRFALSQWTPRRKAFRSDPRATKLDLVVTPGAEEFAFIDHLMSGIEAALGVFGLHLTELATQQLREDLRFVVTHALLAEREIEAVDPAAILLSVDNLPPTQAYVFLARSRGIPTVLIQHGLDCDHDYYEEAYADSLALWGEARLRRYRSRSLRQPARMTVVGNSEYDAFRLPGRMDFRGDGILWLTRPHLPGKCFLPSRLPSEGLAIFEALADFAARDPSGRLVVKPHNGDYLDLYLERAEAWRGRARVEVTSRDLHDLLPEARVVVTEDSTAGLDAMFHGKVLVMSHFAASPPVLPLVASGAALPGFSARELHSSLQRAHHLPADELEAMREAQRRFLLDHAGPCDGRSGERLARYLENVVAG